MLKCYKDFVQGQHAYKIGDVVNVDPVVESWLLDSFPAHFVREAIEAQPKTPAEELIVEPVEVEQADVSAPAADKAIKRPRGRK